MIDLHGHTLFSDGALLPAHAALAAKAAGYRALAFTDHVDGSNLEFVLDHLLPAVRLLGPSLGIDLFAGVELTFVPPGLIADFCAQARQKGAQIVVCHGESLSETPPRGTNLAAIEAGVDVLAHPGLITETEARLAAERGVLLEISTKPKHALANGHVAATARRVGAGLVVNNDAHRPGDYVPADKRRAIQLGAGMTDAEIQAADRNAESLLNRLIERSRRG